MDDCKDDPGFSFMALIGSSPFLRHNPILVEDDDGMIAWDDVVAFTLEWLRDFGYWPKDVRTFEDYTAVCNLPQAATLAFKMRFDE